MLDMIEKNLVALYLNRVSAVSTEDVNGILELAHTEGNLRFYHVRFDEGDHCLWNEFFRKMNDQIVSYCLDRKEYAKPNKTDLKDEARRLFLESSTTGEPGELILYFLAEGVMRAPKILSKMRLKTSTNMPVHGADGVHLGIIDNQLHLFFGESKMYQKSRSAISAALESMDAFIEKEKETDETKKDHELRLIRRFVDISNPVVKKIFLHLLNPYKSSIAEAFVCFIGFGLGDSCLTCSITKCMEMPCLINKVEFIAQYKAEMQECINKTKELVAGRERLKTQPIYFFFLPFTLVEKYRNKFLEVVK